MTREFKIGDRNFKLNKINAFKQFHIVRRIAPILADMLPAMKDISKVAKGENISESEKLEEFAKIAQPIMLGLSKLSDQDADKVLFGLLSSVEVQNSGVYSYIATDTALMMQDLDLSVLLQCAGRAFAYNLSGFFTVLPQVP